MQDSNVLSTEVSTASSRSLSNSYVDHTHNDSEVIESKESKSGIYASVSCLL